jgi:hypothetical protein
MSVFSDACITRMDAEVPFVMRSFEGEIVTIPLIPKGDRTTLLSRVLKALQEIIGYALQDDQVSYQDLCRDNRIGIVFTPSRFGVYVR